MSSTVTVKVRPGNERMMASFVRALDEAGTLQVSAFSVSYAAGGILAVPEAETKPRRADGGSPWDQVPTNFLPRITLEQRAHHRALAGVHDRRDRAAGRQRGLLTVVVPDARVEEASAHAGAVGVWRNFSDK